MRVSNFSLSLSFSCQEMVIEVEAVRRVLSEVEYSGRIFWKSLQMVFSSLLIPSQKASAVARRGAASSSLFSLSLSLLDEKGKVCLHKERVMCTGKSMKPIPTRARREGEREKLERERGKLDEKEGGKGNRKGKWKEEKTTYIHCQPRKLCNSVSMPFLPLHFSLPNSLSPRLLFLTVSTPLLPACSAETEKRGEPVKTFLSSLSFSFGKLPFYLIEKRTHGIYIYIYIIYIYMSEQKERTTNQIIRENGNRKSTERETLSYIRQEKQTEGRRRRSSGKGWNSILKRKCRTTRTMWRRKRMIWQRRRERLMRERERGRFRSKEEKEAKEKWRMEGRKEVKETRVRLEVITSLILPFHSYIYSNMSSRRE